MFLVKLNLDYIYRDYVDQYVFNLLPTALLDDLFPNISTNAKLLYSLMLSRLSLSKKNGWHDENGRVYIVFTIKEIEKTFNCTSKPAIKLLDELDSNKGVSLIERKRLGLTNASHIYLNDFMSILEIEKEKKEVEEKKRASVTAKIRPLNEFNINNFSYIRIPQLFHSDDTYKKLAGNVKLLYSLLLNKVSLSRQNDWIDEMDRVYINFTTEEAMKGLLCSKPTALSTFKSLEEIGLIERINCGVGIPSRIYVKDFYSIMKNKTNKENVDMDYERDELNKVIEPLNTEGVIYDNSIFGEVQLCESKKYNSAGKESTIQRVKKVQFSE